MPKNKPHQNVKPLEEEKDRKIKGYHPEGDELKVYNQYKRRKSELLDSRRSVNGIDIDELMRRMDKQYFNREADIPASELDPDQRPVAINNAFGKVQSALGILIDRNPEISLEEDNPKYSANRELIKGLAKSSWRNTNSLGQLKLSIFNCAKRGWFVGRTYYRALKHDARFLETVEEDEKTGEKTYKYVTKEITKVDDVAYMNLNNFNVWLDEQTVPEDMYSTRDWTWREVMHIDDVRKMFPEAEYPNIKFVKEGGNTQETLEGQSQKTGATTQSNEAKQTKEGMTEVFFYENQYDDWFIAEVNGVMVVWEPMPQNSKRNSCTYGYWNLRSAESIYGIGIPEMMERDESILDRISNMSMRQLLLTISPPGFYTGTEDPEDENLKYKAGTLRRTLDPKNITFLNIPEGNQHTREWIDWIENKEDQRTGINKQLEGEDSGGKGTAFEAGVNREAGLKRLRLPLKSIQYALDWEFRNRIDLIKQVYTDFQVEQLSDPEDIMNYLEEVEADPDYYHIENEGDAGKESFFKKEYREVQLNVEQDEKGNFVETEDKSFFKIKPDFLAFEGDVIVDAQSILVQSEELEKADTLRMSNIIIPLVSEGDPAKVGRPVKQLLLAFNKDPRKWLPDDWYQSINDAGKLASGEKQANLENPEGAVGEGDGSIPQELERAEGVPNADTVVPPTDLNSKVTLGSRFASAFDSFKNP